MPTAKCPCCRVINTLDEAWKHRSITSAQAAVRAWKMFVEMGNTAELVLAIYPCPKHGSEGGFDAFIDEANKKKNGLVGRAVAEQERRAAENLDRIMRGAVWNVYRSLLGDGKGSA